jgi:anti-sigma regulatory factor (Ser/Thr protein kinase)
LKYRREFPNQLAAITAARRYVADLLEDIPPAPSFDVELMVTELATNCVRHTGSGFILCLDIDDSDIRVEVTDTAPGAPQLRYPTPNQANGRGLHIIEGLSDGWGVEREHDRPGKTVWFTYRISNQ